jgi:hypothetical protein
MPSSPALPPLVPTASRPRAPSVPDADEQGWDDAVELRGSALIPLEGTPTPRVVETAPRAAETAPLPPDPPSVPDTAEPARLDPAAEEQLFAVLRASLEASLLPLVEKQRELEARVEALRAAGPVKGPSTMRSTSPTMPLGPSASAAAKPILTTYGLVTPSIAPKPALDLEAVGPIDVPDFGRSRVGTILIVLLVVGVLGAIVAAIVSHG